MPGIAAETAPRLQLDDRMQMRAEFKQSWLPLQDGNRQQQWGKQFPIAAQIRVVCLVATAERALACPMRNRLYNRGSVACAT